MGKCLVRPWMRPVQKYLYWTREWKGLWTDETPIKTENNEFSQPGGSEMEISGRPTDSWTTYSCGSYIHNNFVLIQDIASKTSKEHWMIETGGEWWSGRSVLAMWHDDDDDDEILLSFSRLLYAMLQSANKLFLLETTSHFELYEI